MSVARGTSPTLVAVVDNDSMALLALKGILPQLLPSAKWLWEAQSADEAVRMALNPETRPRLLLVDMSLGGATGVGVCRKIRMRTDRDDSTIPAADATDITLTDATHGGSTHTGTAYNGGATHGNAARDSTASANTSMPASPLPHRIVVTGAQRLTTFTMTTRRARVQSITRSTTPWREPRGVESAQMSLFVMNGLSDIRFRFLHRLDADALEAWFTGR